MRRVHLAYDGNRPTRGVLCGEAGALGPSVLDVVCILSDKVTCPSCRRLAKAKPL